MFFRYRKKNYFKQNCNLTGVSITATGNPRNVGSRQTFTQCNPRSRAHACPAPRCSAQAHAPPSGQPAPSLLSPSDSSPASGRFTPARPRGGGGRQIWGSGRVCPSSPSPHPPPLKLDVWGNWKSYSVVKERGFGWECMLSLMWSLSLSFKKYVLVI